MGRGSLSEKMLAQIILCCSFSVIAGGLLGAGKGEGSCPAAPFRTEESDLKYTKSCPEWAECCTEYGYCQPKVRSRVYITDIHTGNFPACLPNQSVIKLD